MSNENGQYPPVCVPAIRSSTLTYFRLPIDHAKMHQQPLSVPFLLHLPLQGRECRYKRLRKNVREVRPDGPF